LFRCCVRLKGHSTYQETVCARYIFGILFTDAVLDHIILADLAGQSTEVSDQAELYFGALSSSSTTLYRTISDGLTWHVAADTLRQMEFGEFWVQVFHFYAACRMIV
jgi:hypothetical protein